MGNDRYANIRRVLTECRDIAMEWTLRGRPPECREFNKIAQNLDAVREELAFLTHTSVSVPRQQQPAAVDERMVFRLAVWMAKHDGYEDPHCLIYEGSPPVPWGEVWNRYEHDARAVLITTQQQKMQTGNEQ